MNMTGSTVYSENLGNIDATFRKIIDVSTLPQGIYFLRLTSDHGTVNQKVIVQ